MIQGTGTNQITNLPADCVPLGLYFFGMVLGYYYKYQSILAKRLVKLILSRPLNYILNDHN